MAVTGPGYIIHSFNSTLVQLKVDAKKAAGYIVVTFQFYLSSIKSNIHNSEQGELFLFQFYLSSIKSVHAKFGNLIDHSFNSTLVQLKADYISFIFSTYIEFQFYLSSIKSWY